MKYDKNNELSFHRKIKPIRKLQIIVVFRLNIPFAVEKKKTHYCGQYINVVLILFAIIEFQHVFMGKSLLENIKQFLIL